MGKNLNKKRDKTNERQNSKHRADGESTGGKNSRRYNGKKQDYYKYEDEYTKLKTTLETDGLEIVDMMPDGNCLFRSLSDQLHGDYGNSHADVRSAVCDFMEDNEEDFAIFLVFEDEDDSDQDEEDARDFDDYIENMRRDGEWGGNLEVVAAARLYRRSITVYSETLAAFTIDHGDRKPMGSPLLVSYHDNDHYNSVRNKLNPPIPSKVMVPRSNRRTKKSNARYDSEIDTVTMCLSEAKVTDNTQKANIKRSAPCPCGSGLRYKKCCLAKQKQMKRVERLKKTEPEGYSDTSEGETPQDNIFRVVAI